MSLQDLLEHTIKRLIKFLNIRFESNTKLTLKLKYGMDGTNTKPYNQQSKNQDWDYSKLFCVSVVPLQLIYETTQEICWTNPRPSSIKFCRPLKITYEKETNDLCKEVESSIKNQINLFKPVEIDGCSIGIQMLCTMIDGKVSYSNIFNMHQNINYS